MDREAMDEGMDHVNENVKDLAENLDELEITKEAVAEEMKSFYEIVPCVRVKVFSEGLTLHHRRI
jgi:archaellum component FlaC